MNSVKEPFTGFFPLKGLSQGPLGQTLRGKRLDNLPEGVHAPRVIHAQGIQRFLDSPSHSYSKCLGSAQLLLGPQAITTAPARIPMLRAGFFPCQT